MNRRIVVMKLPITSSCSLLNHPNSFCRGMFKLNAKSDTDSLFCLLTDFECDGHTVHMLTQRCLLPLVTSIVKSSLFMHVHSSPLSLAARLYQSYINRSFHINNGWTFPDRHCTHTHKHKYIYMCIYIHTQE